MRGIFAANSLLEDDSIVCSLICCAVVVFSYIRCFYWSLLSLATINDNLPNPTNTPEYTFTMFNYLLGVFVMALFISQVSEGACGSVRVRWCGVAV